MKLVPREDWTVFSHLLIWHGRRRCYARNPDCAHCEVFDLCPRIGVKQAGPARQTPRQSAPARSRSA